MASSGDLTLTILHTLDKTSPIQSQDAFPQTSFNELKAALDRLASRSMVTYEQLEKDQLALEAEAEQIVANGSHEARVFDVLSKHMDGLSVQDLEKEIGDKNVTKLGQGKAFREKWVGKTADGKLKALVSILQAIGLSICSLQPPRCPTSRMSPESSSRPSRTHTATQMPRS